MGRYSTTMNGWLKWIYSVTRSFCVSVPLHLLRRCAMVMDRKKILVGAQLSIQKDMGIRTWY